MKYKVNKSIVYQGAIFTPDKEYELTPDQVEGLRKRGALEGDTGASDEVGSTPGELETQLVEVLRPHVSETGESEGAVDVLNRIIGEREDARAENEKLQAQLAEETKNREAAESDLEKALSGSTPGDPFAVAKELGVEAVGSLLKGGFDSQEKIKAASDKDLEALPGIGDATVKKIRALLK